MVYRLLSCLAFAVLLIVPRVAGASTAGRHDFPVPDAPVFHKAHNPARLPLAPHQPVIPEAIEPDPTVQGMMAHVTSSVLAGYVQDLSGMREAQIGGQPYTIRTRYNASGAPIQKATQYVGEHLAALGLDVDYHQWADQTRCPGGSCPNVIGEITGVTDPEDVFILSAHLDDLPSGSTAPGADDNASGVAGVLAAADVLSRYRWGCTLRFALWTGEESGLWGSQAYATRAYNQGEKILGVLNLDMIGWDSVGGPDMDLYTLTRIPATGQIAQLFVDVVDGYHLDLVPDIWPDTLDRSDHASFWLRDYPAVLVIEDYYNGPSAPNDFNKNYHTANDTLASLDMSYFTEIARASLGTFVHMSDCLMPVRRSYLPVVLREG